jgi:RNA methyltransferase, TrmH family
MKSIRSRDNPFYKDVARISSSARQRNKYKQTLLDGAHLLTSYLDSGNRPRHILLNGESADDVEIAGLLQRTKGVPVTRLDNRLFAGLSELKTPSGILALIEIPRPAVLAARFALLLDDIQDPGNLGSILRSAAAAGCDSAFLSSGCADAWSPKVLRASMGGHFVVRLHEQQDLQRVAKSFSGMVLATTLQSRHSLYDCDLRNNVAFLIGNEGIGLSAELLELATQQISIPMRGKIESLNAAAAAAICLFEAVRQREGMRLAAPRHD